MCCLRGASPGSADGRKGSAHKEAPGRPKFPCPPAGGRLGAARPWGPHNARMGTLLAAVVEASSRVADTNGRLAKRDAIAACLRSAQADEVEIAVAYLSGETCQGRIGIGHATLAALRGSHASQPGLALREVDAVLERVAATSGKGSSAERVAQLRALFERATAVEQDFLLRLLVGELRQGALEGVMIGKAR